MSSTAMAALAATGSAVTSVVYINFSARVMPRLAALPPAEGISTMQAFNRAALQPPFMLAFFGAAVGSLVVLARVVRPGAPVGRTWSDWVGVAGAVCYLAGFVITVVYNVPRNDRLAAVDPTSGAAAGVWADYVAQWTTANTARAVLSGVATVALGVCVTGWSRAR